MAFQIDEGYVRVSARIDRSSLAKAAKEAGENTGEEMEKGTRQGFSRSSRKNKAQVVGLLRTLFTPDPKVFESLRAPFEKALSTPITLAASAVAAIFVVYFLSAITTALSPAALGAAFIGIGIAAVASNKKIRSEFDKTKEQIKKTFAEAAKPLIGPLVDALKVFGNAVKELGPQFRQVFSAMAPAIVPLAQGVSDFVAAFMQALTADPAALEGMRDALIAIGNNLPRIGTALGEMFATLAKNESNVQNIGRLFGLLSEAIGLLGFALIEGTKAFDRVALLWGFFSDSGSAAIDWLTGTAVPAIVGAFNAVVGFFQSIPGWVAGAWASVTGFFSGLWNTVSTFVMGVVNTVVGFFTALPGRIIAAVSALPGMIFSFFNNALNQAAYVIGFVLRTIVGFFAALPGRVIAVVVALPGLVAGVFVNVGNRAMSLVSSIIGAVVGFFSALPGRAYSAMLSIVGRVSSIFTSAKNTASSAASSLVSNVVRIVAQLPGKAASAASSFASRVASALRRAVNSAYQIGRAIVSGVISGMASMGGAMVSRARDLAARAVQGFKDALGISSPSKVFAELGVNTVDGLVQGLSQTSSLDGAMDRLTEAITGQGTMVSSAQTSASSVSNGFSLPSSTPPPSSSGSMTPSFNVQVYVGDREIKDVVRVEINEHDRSLGSQVSAGTGGFRL